MLRQLERQRHARARELEEVGPQQRADVDVAERRRHLLVDDPHHLLGRDAVGRHRGDERAGAGADVDVELVDGAVDREQVERAQGADLVDAAGEAAAAEHERRLGAPRAALALRGRGAPLLARLEVDDLAHAVTDQYGRRDSPLQLVFYGPAACVSTCSPRLAGRRARRPAGRRRPGDSTPPCRRSSRARCATRAASPAPTSRPRHRRTLFAAARRAPCPRLGREALHDVDRAAALRARRHAAHRGRRARLPRPRRRLARRPLPARRRRPDARPRASAPRRRGRRGRDHARRRLGARRRVALRPLRGASTPAAPTTATSAACSAR